MDQNGSKWIKMDKNGSKWIKMKSISTLVPTFGLEEAESIASSVKITTFPTNFDPKSSKMDQKWIKMRQNEIHFDTGTKI